MKLEFSVAAFLPERAVPTPQKTADGKPGKPTPAQLLAARLGAVDTTIAESIVEDVL